MGTRKRLTQPENPTPRTERKVSESCRMYGAAEATAKYQLPDTLITAIMTFESKGNTHAQSTDNCIGLMQLDYRTACSMHVDRRLTALKHSPEAAKQFLKDHPDVNMKAGAKYLRYVANDLHKFNERLQAEGKGLRFDVLDANGNITEQGVGIVLAAYNGGPGVWPGTKKLPACGLKRNIALNGERWYDHVPTESHNYILNITSYMEFDSPERSAGAMVASAKPSAKPLTPEQLKTQVNQVAAQHASEGTAAISAALRANPDIAAALQRAIGTSDDGKFFTKSQAKWDAFETRGGAGIEARDGLTSVKEALMAIGQDAPVQHAAAKPVAAKPRAAAPVATRVVHSDAHPANEPASQQLPPKPKPGVPRFLQ